MELQLKYKNDDRVLNDPELCEGLRAYIKAMNQEESERALKSVIESPLYDGAKTFLGFGAFKGVKGAGVFARASKLGKGLGNWFKGSGAGKTSDILDGALTKGKIKKYLETVDKLEHGQLITDMRKLGFKYLDDQSAQANIYKFTHPNRRTKDLLSRKEILEKGIKRFEPGSERALRIQSRIDKLDKQIMPALKNSKYMVELHHDGPSGYHMHIIDRHGHIYDKNLNNLTNKYLPETRDRFSQIKANASEEFLIRKTNEKIAKEFPELNHIPIKECKKFFELNLELDK